MTQPHPQQEYIITEDMLRWWRNQCIAEPAHTDTDQCKKCKYRGKGSRTGCCDFGDDDMEKIFRSRPHTPAPAPERTQSDRNLCQEFILTRKELSHIYSGFYHYDAILDILTERGTVEHDSAIRKDERKRVLDTLNPIINRLRREATAARKWPVKTLGVAALINEMESAANILESLRGGA